MMLLLDIGNSRIKWAVSDGGALSGLGAVEHRGDPAGAFNSLDWPKAEAVWVAHVTGAEHEARLAQRIEARYGLAPQFARSAAQRDGLRVAYAEPQRLGVDRFLMMLALWRERRGAFCVAAAGTALTFDAVDADGRHLGGLIAAGLETHQRSVLGATRFTVRPTPQSYTGGLGQDTEGCVREAALHACLGLIERASRHREGAKVICGGDAPTLLPHLPGWEHRPNLVLEGLQAYACSN